MENSDKNHMRLNRTYVSVIPYFANGSHINCYINKNIPDDDDME